MHIVGYLASVLIGLSLGIIGGGGSILTVPVLVYLLGVDPLLGTAYSLFIVGITSAVGSYSYFRQSWVDLRTVLLFGPPSILAVFLTRAYLVPAIPPTILTIGNLTIDRSMLLMLLFAVLMLLASISMIKPSKESDKKTATTLQSSKGRYLFIFLEGAIVGTLTGLVGAGGGFLIIPALVLFGGLSMKKAIGTSLVIIAAKSLLGFLGEQNLSNLDWQLLLTVTALSMVGILIGTRLSQYLDGEKLKPVFGWFVFVMGVYIIFKEIFL